MVALLRQILVAELIMLAAFVGLMMLTVDLNEQLQGHAAAGNGVRGIGYSRRNFRFRSVLAFDLRTRTMYQHQPDP